ncbi:MAG TPA: aminotransferase class III-fold pyridoxal phosphate-dependent enzyme [Candidatus Limnocylindria bacterium]|nr:aminotransferase class III-fold pyridoxal phosphate-dependent enzyme [Candidatus Limnocylindria bacterium]
MAEASIASDRTRVFPLELDRLYPVVVRGDGVWVEDSAGKRYLDAMSGGSMAATLGHGRRDIIAAARDQALQLSYVHNERLTNPARERLAAELVEVAPAGMTRVRFTTGGAESNEAALQMARSYHVERGDTKRWHMISPAQAYHGPTMATLALTGRPGLQRPFGPYLSMHHHIPPSTWRFDPTGQAALDALDRVLEEVGPENVSAYFCEPVTAAALPAYSPPELFWKGLAERRDKHGFLVLYDEVVTGMGRTGHWFAADKLPLVPDIIATAKGLGAGYAAIGGVICRDHVYQAFANGSRKLTHGHTWDGAPVTCAVGLRVIEVLREEGLIERMRTKGPKLRDELAAALADIPMVREVRGHGFLLGVEYVDPRDGKSFLPPELGTARRVDLTAMDLGLIVYSTMPTRDGYAGDQTLFAPPFTTTDTELTQMVERFTNTVRNVAKSIEAELK